MFTVLVFQDSAFSYVTSDVNVFVKSVLIRSHKPSNLDGKFTVINMSMKLENNFRLSK